MTQAYVCNETSEKPKPSFIVGPGGVPIPQINLLKHLAPNGQIKLMCITWNMASRSQISLSKICELAASRDVSERSDLIAFSLQELPVTNAKYHQEAVQTLSDSLRDTHRIFCWVRKWTQMLMVFIRPTLIKYASPPQWQFISTSVIVKPMRTKGAIAVTFQLFQTTIALVSCHLSHGPLVYRRNDYLKIYDTLKYCVKKLFWFGDMNFRILDRRRFDVLKEHNRFSSYSQIFTDLLADDELTIEKTKGNIFEGFTEAEICFPPTHKFIIGTDEYVCNRIPSYTDRILYLSRENGTIRPIVYNALYDENSSDHKPVFAIFNVRVSDCRD
ncbi:unnamed protein product [Enterobius vermicularis]|uniref:IPPc domain-containing protein n=1 Tax=Enterobius vermicularis TaxID=51028 RepID=A0A0N4USL1_ENTVE|nr:unnamed protein product [Enterobius vermicularis]